MENSLNIAMDAVFNWERHALAERLRSFIANGRMERFLWSTESLISDWGMANKDIYLRAKHLRDLVDDGSSDLKVQIMLTIRRQTDALPSFFAQIPFKYPQFYRPELESFLHFALTSTSHRFAQFFDFDYIYDIYTRFFGSDNVWVFPMEGLFTSEKTETKRRFAALFGLPSMDELPPFSQYAENRRRVGDTASYRVARMPHWYVGPRRLYNRTVKAKGLDPANLPGIRATKNSVRCLVRRQVDNSLSDAWRERIEAYYRTGNRHLAEQTGIDLAGYGYPVAAE